MNRSHRAQKTNLKGFSLKELQDFVESLGEKKFRARQLFTWIYAKRAKSFDEMSDISIDFRSLLTQTASLEALEAARTQVSSSDGTVKFLFRLSDGLMIESVLIPAETDSPGAEKRLTLCVSTQVGCPLDCKFCATGTMGFFRNLTTGEILDQVLQAQQLSPKRITNLVYMGMGEPMLNYDNVMKSIDLITDDHGLNIGARRITVSTAGYADRIRQMADEGRKTKLALSLHAVDDEKRSALMPINRKYNVGTLLTALEYYYKKTRRRPTIEYILFEGFNDTDQDIMRLREISKRVPCKVNLIPFHSIAFTHPGGIADTLRPAPRHRIEEFARKLRAGNLTVMIRSSSGEDIDAACGQLAVDEQQRIAKPLGVPHSIDRSLPSVV